MPRPSLKFQLIAVPTCFVSVVSTTDIFGSSASAAAGSVIALFAGTARVRPSSSGSSSSNTSAMGEAFAIADGRCSNGTSSGALSVLRCEGATPPALCMARLWAEKPRWWLRGLVPLGVLNGPSAASRSITGLIMSESTRFNSRGCQEA